MRAIAVLLVVWTHYAETFSNFAGSQLFLDSIQMSVNFGRIGVVIFFAISGFLIPSSLKGEIGEGTRRFIIRRFFRLFPAYWVSLPIGYFAVWWLYGRSLPPADILAGLTMVQGALNFEHIMGHYWTLETELFFYVVCLLLFWAGGIHNFRSLAAVSAFLAVTFCAFTALRVFPDQLHGAYKGLLFHIAIMFWGACIRCAYDGVLNIRDKTVLVVLTAGLLMIGGAIAAKGAMASDYSFIASGLAYIIGMIAFLFFLTRWKIKNRVMTWIGKISYSLYLLHPVPLYVISWICVSNGLTGAPLGLYMIIAFVPALLLSWLSYEAVERVGVAISDRFTGRYQKQQLISP